MFSGSYPLVNRKVQGINFFLPVGGALVPSLCIFQVWFSEGCGSSSFTWVCGEFVFGSKPAVLSQSPHVMAAEMLGHQPGGGLSLVIPRQSGEMINKSLLCNINKLQALPSRAPCHPSKSCVSKALICESLFSYLASVEWEPPLPCCKTNICLFCEQCWQYDTGTRGWMEGPLSKEVPLKTFLLDHSNCQLILSSVYIKTITVFPK